MKFIFINSQDHPLAHATVNKLSELSNESYHATELTLTIAQKGQLLATNVVAFYDALNKKDSSLEYLDTLLSKLNTIADKGYGRSIEAHGRLICLCAGLSKVGPISISGLLYTIQFPFDVYRYRKTYHP